MLLPIAAAAAVLLPVAAAAGSTPSVSGSWKSLPALPKGLWGSSLGTMPDGGLITVAGMSESGVNTTGFVYNAKSASWSSADAMPTASTSSAGATAVNGDLYVVTSGGFEIFDTKTAKWSAGPNLPAGVASSAVTALADGDVLSIGGHVTQKPTGNVYSYSPSTNAWTTLAPMPETCNGMAAATGPNGLVYVVGGNCGSPKDSNKMYVFDPTANTWTEGPAMPGVAVYGAAAAFGGNGLLYVMGGTESESASPQSQVWKFDLSTTKWSKGPALPAASWSGSAVAARSGKYIVYAGGATGTGCGNEVCALSDVWELNT
jgi:N-acetylneuraminic acid mutarotase